MEAGREKLDLCESPSENSEPKSQPTEKMFNCTKLAILGQPLVFLYPYANQTFVAFT